MINPIYLVVFLNIVFVIIAIYSVSNSNKSATKKFLWILLLIVLEMAGAILYYSLQKKE